MNELILADLGTFILYITMAFFLIVFMGVIFSTRKSKDYRKYLTDMYVAAKIRLLAKNDGLDIEKEQEDFKIWNKKQKVKSSEYNLDDAVEEDLIEKIEEPVTKTKK